MWKSTWLPPSQTFVRDQLAAMTRWAPLRLGVRDVPDALVHADRAPFGPGRVGRAAHRLSAATGHRGVYDRVLRERGARLVHAHFGTSAVGVLPVARRLGLPLVVTFHGYDVTREPGRGAAGARYVERLRDVFAYADTLLAVSDHLAGRLVDLGAPEHKVRVHHVGIPVEAAAPPVTVRDGVVLVGRLVDVKGPRDLVAAAARLPEPYRGVPVRVVGDGPLARVLADDATAAGVHLELLGRLPSPHVAAELARAAVFCGPSRTTAEGQEEAFGIVFLEAALHGLPVVAYRHGGVPEAVVDGVTGLLAPEGDVDALAAHLGSLLADPARAATLGAAGRARVLRDFDVRTQTARLEEVYDEVVARAAVRRYST
ncbi:glycosyltransferase [Cellulomonas carbonis]|uniref:Glycosyl transferase n=1 Tax=Cellulomonas carbonis T26 TaxID=947969 RepID=A0A0A0BNU2_9CELL|nr:glycosyltransferase [Cellulomonas carbonis]KGM09337.1 glycosyl transferase [Cellulomonas carbonis T26]GGC16548.1 glycosyl transferase family 1 [Cellulomonas carbonis]